MIESQGMSAKERTKRSGDAQGKYTQSSVATKAAASRTKNPTSRSTATSSLAPSTSASARPLYPNSKASLRPNPNARSPLFKSRVMLEQPVAASTDQANSRRDGSKLSSVQWHLRRLLTRKAFGDVESVVDACNHLAQHWGRNGVLPSHTPYHALLEALSYRSMLDECYHVLEDMQRTGLEVDLASLNFTLKAAVMASRHDHVLHICQKINELNPNNEAELQESDQSGLQPSSRPENLALPSPSSTRNFNNFTYTCLFQCFASSNRPEEALLWFSALARSKPTPAQAFLDLLRPSAVKYLIQTLLAAQEYRLAVEIAEWVHIDGGGRLISPAVWIEIAAACAVGDYFPGLKHGYQRGVSEGGVVIDEGFLITALSTASRAPDSGFCYQLLYDFLAYSTQWINMRIPDTTPPPLLQHAHLLPLVEALARERKFEQTIRLMGAMEYWGLPFDSHTCVVLEREASIDVPHLVQAVGAWEHVIAEGENFIEGEPSPKTSAEDRLSVIRRVAEGKVPALAGRVEVNTMNALIEAAARLGEDDIALKVWEDRRLAKMRPSLSRALSPGQQQHQSEVSTFSPSPSPAVGDDDRPAGAGREDIVKIIPTVETFNSLLKACLMCKLPSVALAHSIFNELKTKHQDHVQPNATTYEHLIKILLHNPSSNPNARLAADALRRAIDRLEECKAAGLTPTASTYESLIRTTLRGASEREDPRWWRLVEDMKQSGYELTLGLLTHIKYCHRFKLWKTDGRQGLTLPPELEAEMFARVPIRKEPRRTRSDVQRDVYDDKDDDDDGRGRGGEGSRNR